MKAPRPTTLRTPHNRDQPAPPSQTGTPPQRRQRIAQAEDDVERGLKDTEGRGVPNNVPKGKK
jgi:hypothetical protein